ncbi:helix-turn-helix domain-containing protein [Aquimarina algiphila]|uniref:Helix-turn-helix domain-containing protein n=1 Tax=Aquimarina algiphila TaxID=2047982 RepID=A0A554VBC5_9FLAO|nr:helix-turn-helix domain-containing protein [Aquimarina algiphila]TSE03810.1 helix-turn-helix domain-containing protein [Aquimarina algiphila]
MTSLRFNYILILFYILFNGNKVNGQESDFIIPDSLVGKSYEQLNESYLKIYNDTLKSNIYLNTILTKAIKDNNRERQARSYCYLSYYAKNDSEKLALLNKSIEISENLSDASYLLLPYSFKGSYYYNKGNYSSALNNYLKILEVAREVNSINYIYITKHNIALVKTHLGKYEEALSLFKEDFLYEKNKKDFDLEYYLESLLALADSYRYNKILDSATFYNKEGIVKSINEYKKKYSSFVINEGINQYYKKNFAAAKDSIDKGLSLKNIYNPLNAEIITLGMYYSGEIQNKLGDDQKALYYFLKQDSLVQKKKIFIPEIRQGYEFIIKNYKQNNDKDKQLEYINKLLDFDSVIYSQRSFVSDKLFAEFEKPTLLKEKQLLIRELEKDQKSIGYWLSISVSVSIAILLLLLFQYKKRKTLKKKFDQLIHESTLSIDQKKDNISTKKDNKIGIPKDVVETILSELDYFEKKHLYLEKNITINSLSKNIGTNSKYLSKIINIYKKKSLTTYINDLRIDYMVNALKTNKKLRNYSVQGLAEEVGFNKAESFSSAFKKYTGIQPSYFIKQLNQAEGL